MQTLRSSTSNTFCTCAGARRPALRSIVSCWQSNNGTRCDISHGWLPMQFAAQQRPQLPQLQQRRLLRCSSSSGVTEPTPAPVVVVEGDIVTFHMTCSDLEGNVLESTKDTTKDNEPMAFEIGAGDIVSNPLFQAFDGALRGLAVGEEIELQISGGDWKKDLLFVVPRDHPEIERLENRYKNMGGLHEGLAVELANGSMAVVVESTPEAVKLDANNMMAGKQLLFTLQVLKIERTS